MPRVKKIPLRKCVGCQEMKPKKELIRIVRTPENRVEVDHTGKRAGRGAYICPDPNCLQQAVKARRLEKALQNPIAPEVIESLRQGLAKQ
ncbi:RNase P modulator RnpM [Desulfotomaculum copahuensis]|uniref:Nucleic acid-binding protein n=1 Tax=Desulfotomaculum copahuensis TaxID=1838280 RepID=A0A1B7LHT4_9FIRM|nr:YlxR family protein [Desulfotomaculum copahuensis]OAT85866.1 nucleic acid-binding protein [Desulfotomaculum copahuensis]